jgi:hypothetical protein
MKKDRARCTIVQIWMLNPYRNKTSLLPADYMCRLVCHADAPVRKKGMLKNQNSLFLWHTF